jgi:hypothetical protein
MFRSPRILLTTLLLSLAWIGVPARATAEVQSQLHLKKAHYGLDENGHVWLRLLFINDDGAPLGVIAIAPDRQGPWTAVNEKVQPGALLRGSLKAGDKGLTVIWANTSQGLVQFQLPKKH